MAGYKNPKSICEHINAQEVDDGTTARLWTMPPGSAGTREFSGEGSAGWYAEQAPPRWTAANDWPDTLGMDPTLMRNYKDVWVRGHSNAIRTAVSTYGIPAELLAGICWLETGRIGDIAIYDMTGWARNSELFGEIDLSKFTPMAETDDVAAELATAMAYLDLELDDEDQQRLFFALQRIDEGLSSAAKHLWFLKELDFPGETLMGEEEIRVIAARYYRGPQWSIEEIESDYSYGDFIVEPLMGRLKRLLEI
jgi:hypothetical protein